MKEQNFNVFQFQKSLSKKLQEETRWLEPIRLAVQELERSGLAKYQNLGVALPAQQLHAVSTAYFNDTRLFNDQLARILHDVLDSYHKEQIANAAAIAAMMSTSFQDLVHPTIYYLEDVKPFSTISDISSPLSSVLSTIDTSWLSEATPWLMNASKISSFDTSALAGVDAKFSKLINLEIETSSLEIIANQFAEVPSVSAQLASIDKLLSGVAIPWREIIAPAELLDRYSSFVLQQHKSLQKAASKNDEKSVAWRLSLIENTSKFIDRQIAWANELIIDSQDSIDSEDLYYSDSELSISAIPQHIGYAKRDDKSVNEAFVESSITIITEKGKLIVERARHIRDLCGTTNGKRLFHDTNRYLSSYMELAGTFCQNAHSLQTILDALDLLFYEQRDDILELIDINDFNCVKDIRELNESKDFPKRSKEITNLQSTLYDQILVLENRIIEKLRLSVESTQHTISMPPITSENKFSEQAISTSILKALCKLQKNKVYHGKSEDELNDGLRDSLSMIYSDTKDQTRQGISPTGKRAGEVDLQICNDGLPVAMIECLKVNSLNRNYIKDHIDKVLTCYDPVGCLYTYVVIYVTAQNFAEFWRNCFKYLDEEYEFPYEVTDKIHELNHIYTESRHAKAILIRNGREINVHFFALAVQ